MSQRCAAAGPMYNVAIVPASQPGIAWLGHRCMCLDGYRFITTLSHSHGLGPHSLKPPLRAVCAQQAVHLHGEQRLIAACTRAGVQVDLRHLLHEYSPSARLILNTFIAPFDNTHGKPVAMACVLLRQLNEPPVEPYQPTFCPGCVYCVTLIYSDALLCWVCRSVQPRISHSQSVIVCTHCALLRLPCLSNSFFFFLSFL